MALPFVDTDMIIDADQTPETGVAILFNALSIDVTIAANVNVVSRESLNCCKWRSRSDGALTKGDLLL